MIKWLYWIWTWGLAAHRMIHIMVGNRRAEVGESPLNSFDDLSPKI
jgi:hypothetical protein